MESVRTNTHQHTKELESVSQEGMKRETETERSREKQKENRRRQVKQKESRDLERQGEESVNLEKKSCEGGVARDFKREAGSEPFEIDFMDICRMILPW